MNTALKMKLEEMNRRLNEALDTDLFEESESEFNEFQAEVDSFERELEEISEFRQDHLQLSELKKIGAIQKKIRQVKNGYNFYDPEYERSVMFPNGEDEEEDDEVLEKMHEYIVDLEIGIEKRLREGEEECREEHVELVRLKNPSFKDSLRQKFSKNEEI